MSACSISVAHIGWSTPDGRAVLDDLNLDFGCERAGLVGRNGIGKSTLLRLLTGALQPARGTIRINGTIGTLRQFVQIAPHETVADLLGARDALALLRKAETGTATIDELAEADWTIETRMAEALAEVGIDVPADTLLVHLSGGQRTRVALAGAVLHRPDFLILDEPTNDLDRNGRAAVRTLLQNWRRGAIVVSHDRELLEAMDALVELTTLGASRYGGNWSRYRERKAIELAATEHDLASAERQMVEVARKAQLTAERKQRRDAAGSRKAARGDMPRILIGMRRDRAEKSGGDNARLANRLRTESARLVANARERIERVETMAVTLAPTGLPPSQEVVALDHVTAGYTPGHPILRDVSLTIVGPERIAITGANGSGKSTLLHLITGLLTPWSGRIAIRSRFAFFDQRVSLLDPTETIVENYARLNPGVGDNLCRTALARFQFRGDVADRRADMLSGGQMLRAGLACVLGSASPPPLMILDEPTNHLDIELIAAVEAGLKAYDGALIVVSHDPAFLAAIGITRTIERNL
ncbi:ABC-F family ATP-binding cassette domain-containing protein [Sphingomonas sp. MMS24-J13]|uniref:ABC-F family ATP-binding cassette domain-containing protein n=1 Tax=Sphingomonas sp. MMS24-J13 TaxID=3238686 RepID=UPI00384BFD2C